MRAQTPAQRARCIPTLALGLVHDGQGAGGGSIGNEALRVVFVELRKLTLRQLRVLCAWLDLTDGS